ncbi:helix-turn-helix domain-containing protein [Nocardiopsis sp. NPDC055879]
MPHEEYTPPGIYEQAPTRPTGLAPANVAVLKNGRAKAVRFTTLDAIGHTLGRQPGDVLRWVPDQATGTESGRARGRGRRGGRPPILRPDVR